jgi:secondary thiamine-phosphate synthase enzyme
LITQELRVDTSRSRCTDLTPQLRRFCADKGDGLVQAFVPHATAGLALIELGAGVEADLLKWLEQNLSRNDSYRHQHGSRGHGADHLVPALLSASVLVPVLGGTPQLGTWQSLALIDTNAENDRRRVRLSFLPG